MCGICGKLNFDRGANVSPALVKSMADTIHHRGPDDEGYYSSGPVGLGFRRLSIIDLNTGHQPICNEDGTVWIVFNGEIYNYLELRQLLQAKGHVFKTQTDTEVIVHLYEEFGEACVQRLRGMFAFAIWDDRAEVLFLARDRVGIKPLYYWLSNTAIIFASEIKAILADPEVKREISPAMIDRFLTFLYVPGEETLLKNVYKLLPGYCLVVKEGRVRVTQYWELDFSPTKTSLDQAEKQLFDLLDDCVRLHMISDVPVGFLLSGGVDSTAMLGFAKGKTDRPLISFTVGFSSPGVIDERPYATLAARRYGTEHHEMTINAKDFADFLPGYIRHMEEPVCEPPAVALYYVSRFAKDYVKVLVSGEGGDEAFGGYQNYRNLLWLERFKSLLGPFNKPLSHSLIGLNRFLGAASVAKYAPLLGVPFESYYYSRASNGFTFFNQNTANLYASDFASCISKEYSISVVGKYLANGSAKDLVNRMLYVDTKTWLADDLLLKADKMTMANSVELRVPFLDHKMLEFAASLPGSYKVRGFTTKYIAKKALNRLVPQAILDRKKTGFPVPYHSWLKTDLRDWLCGILLDRKTLSRGYFQKSTVEDLLSKDLRFGGYSKEVFSLAVLELWHREFLEKKWESEPQTLQPSWLGSPAV